VAKKPVPTAYSDVLLRYAKEPWGLTVYGDVVETIPGVFRLPVKKGIFIGSLELWTDSNGNPNSIQLSMSAE